MKKHENGHERIMHQYLDNLHLKLASSKNKDDAEGKFQKVMAAYKQADDRHDAGPLPTLTPPPIAPAPPSTPPASPPKK